MSKKYLIVGAGIFGAVLAHELAKLGNIVCVLEKRNHVGGNIYTEEIEGIQVHKYGAHIFHTNNTEVWEYINQFAEFNRYTNAPIANFQGEVYNLPFNMNTFNKLWGCIYPKEAAEIIEKQRAILEGKPPKNLEEQAISLVGVDIFEKLIKGYTEKQWGRECTSLPPFIIKRLPVRFTYDNNYFNDRYQGIPIGGYTQIIEKMLNHSHIDVQLNTDYLDSKEDWNNQFDKVIYTGMIDQFYDYCYGELEYRSLSFDTTIFNMSNFQGNAVVNYTDRETPYTRIIEHKHFEFGQQEKTVITKEYPRDWHRGDEPYYPLNNRKNNQLYKKYLELSLQQNKILFGGRLGMYRYMDMDMTIHEALKLMKETRINS